MNYRRLAMAETQTHAAQPRTRRGVVVHVNEQPVQLADRRATGLEIKTAAIERGVRIELDFILVEELANGRTRIVGDDDVVHLTKKSRFTANDGDDDA
jgi:Multiubiquitin